MTEIRPRNALLPDNDTAPLDAAGLAAYLHRIGIDDAPDTLGADVHTLHRVVAAHATTIPFGALDAHTGTTPDLGADGLLAKLVHGSREGWCFEHNGLLRRALGALGYPATGMSARVRWGERRDAPPTVRTHMTLLVDVDGDAGGERWIADVGFGGMVPTAPLRLEHGVEQKTPLEPFRLLRGPAEVPGVYGAETWTVQALVAGEWRALYTFELAASAQIDHEMANFYLVAHPGSPFRANLIAARPGPDRRTNLGNRKLTVYHADGPAETTELGSPSEIRDALEDNFGIDTSGVEGLDARLAEQF